MKQEDLDRINELARKSRSPEGLTDQEKEEQIRLRKAYVAAFRQSLESQLENTYVVGPDGIKRKLPKKEGVL